MTCRYGTEQKLPDNENASAIAMSTSESKLKRIQEATVKPDELKLKRSKPLKRTESALEKTLGIRRKTQT
jgi:hypothetical protein